MNEMQRLQQLAGITIQEDEEVMKDPVGHVDDEKEAMRKDLYQMGTYCVELYKIVSAENDNADFPHWIQAKLTKAKDYISTVKHYLENDQQVPDSDEEQEVYVSPDAEDYNDPSGVS